MPNKCSVCNHKKITYINKAILGGQTISSMAIKYGLSRGALTRHKKKCIAAAVSLAQKKAKPKARKKKTKDYRTIKNQEVETIKQESAGEKIVRKLEGLEKEARVIQVKATESKNYTAALSAIKEQSRIFDIYIHMAEAMNKQNKNELEEILESWEDMKEILLDLFVKHPKAGDDFEVAITQRLAQHW